MTTRSSHTGSACLKQFNTEDVKSLGCPRFSCQSCTQRYPFHSLTTFNTQKLSSSLSRSFFTQKMKKQATLISERERELSLSRIERMKRKRRSWQIFRQPFLIMQSCKAQYLSTKPISYEFLMDPTKTITLFIWIIETKSTNYLVSYI